MNIEKLGKRLRKELLANPKQAVVLAIVSLVACWFWSPLLLKWFKGKAKTPVATSAPVPATETMAAKTETQRPWFDIHRWRQVDPLTRSAPPAEEARDPFQLPRSMVAVKQQEEAAQEKHPQAVPVQPEDLNLTLEAIVYGGSRRLAQINGMTVLENEELVIDGAAEGGEKVSKKSVGRVVAIRPTEVLLEIGGQPLRLTLQPKLLGRGEVVKRLRTK